MTEAQLVYDPVAPCLAVPHEAQRSLDSLSGKVIGFIDNAKPNFNFLADDLAELLLSKYGVSRIVKLQKRAASMPAPAGFIDDLAQQCDLVITGSGD